MLPEGLFAILDENYSGSLSTAQIIEAFLDAEAIPFIVRNKAMSQKEYEDYIREIDEMKREMDFDFIVHNHLNLAQETQAMGIHLTAQSDPVSEARKLLGPNSLIGYSAHSIDEAMEAKSQGADYIFLGAIFETPKKDPNHPILGVEELAQACRRIEIPIYAIGGISSENLTTIKDCGAAGFGALRAIYENDEVEHNVSKLNFIWEDFE